jgi:hypothetical protein
MLPPSEWTIDWLRRFHYVYAGSVSDVRRVMDTLVEGGNPEYLDGYRTLRAVSVD